MAGKKNTALVSRFRSSYVTSRRAIIFLTKSNSEISWLSYFLFHCSPFCAPRKNVIISVALCGRVRERVYVFRVYQRIGDFIYPPATAARSVVVRWQLLCRIKIVYSSQSRALPSPRIMCTPRDFLFRARLFIALTFISDRDKFCTRTRQFAYLKGMKES